MTGHDRFRRQFMLSALSLPVLSGQIQARAARKIVITQFGARPDGVTINTQAIQNCIDHLAQRGGGTLVVPSGIFISGALFLKPKVNLHLDNGAVLKCTNDMRHFPRQRTRIEGHFEESFTPALINADGCDGLKISGTGTLDGSGRPVWDRYWTLRKAAPDPNNFSNVGIERARLALVQNSQNVMIEGVTFKDSQFWNLHLYKCSQVTVRNTRFVVPDDYVQAPSSDGIDLDSCHQVLVEGCYFSVTDDCIAAKGTKGPHAMEDVDSPPVEQVRVSHCEFRRGHQAFSCGSEATIVRDVIMEDCRVTGAMTVLRLKLRPDTPQRYENIQVRNIFLDNAGGQILLVGPWSQYKNLGDAVPPKSTVNNVVLCGVRGRFGSFGSVQPNYGQTKISAIVLKDFDVQLTQNAELAVSDAGVTFENVMVNGRAISAAGKSLQ